MLLRFFLFTFILHFQDDHSYSKKCAVTPQVPVSGGFIIQRPSVVSHLSGLDYDNLILPGPPIQSTSSGGSIGASNLLNVDRSSVNLDPQPSTSATAPISPLPDSFQELLAYADGEFPWPDLDIEDLFDFDLN